MGAREDLPLHDPRLRTSHGPEPVFFARSSCGGFLDTLHCIAPFAGDEPVHMIFDSGLVCVTPQVEYPGCLLPVDIHDRSIDNASNGIIVYSFCIRQPWE